MLVQNSVGHLGLCVALAICLACSTNTASSQTTTSAAPLNHSDFTGNWQLIENAEEKENLEHTIKDSTSAFSPFKQRIAQKVIRKMTSADNELKMVDSGNQLTLYKAGHEFILGTDGQTVNLSGPLANATLSAEKVEDHLIVHIRNSDGSRSRTVLYSISEDGSRMTQQIELMGEKLQEPISVTNHYRRR